jgi:hypothetical protein
MKLDADLSVEGLGYKQLHGKAKLSVFRNEDNLGYGGNQIRGYKYAIEQGHLPCERDEVRGRRRGVRAAIRGARAWATTLPRVRDVTSAQRSVKRDVHAYSHN